MSKLREKAVVLCRCSLCGTYNPPMHWGGTMNDQWSFLSFWFRCRHCGVQQAVFTGTPDRTEQFVAEMEQVGFVTVEACAARATSASEERRPAQASAVRNPEAFGTQVYVGVRPKSH